jgi:hypothetical protein
MKQYHQSASRPEIRKDFRLAQFSSHGIEKSEGFFNAVSLWHFSASLEKARMDGVYCSGTNMRQNNRYKFEF